MPLAQSVLNAAAMTLDDIDAFAVSSGPGSFTGLRISASAVKGMAFALNRPVYGVSTLLSLAYNLLGRDVTACAVMDARRGEVYNALFDVSGEVVTRLTPDRAITLDELECELSEIKKAVKRPAVGQSPPHCRSCFANREIVLVGDGALMAYEKFAKKFSLATEAVRYQSAASVCFAADTPVTAKELMPTYIRRPQAERDRQA